MAQCPAMQQDQPEPIKGVFKLPDNQPLFTNAATIKSCVSLLHGALSALGYAGDLLTDLANGKVNNENYLAFLERVTAVGCRTEAIREVLRDTGWLYDEVLLYGNEVIKELEE